MPGGAVVERQPVLALADRLRRLGRVDCRLGALHLQGSALAAFPGDALAPLAPRPGNKDVPLVRGPAKAAEEEDDDAPADDVVGAHDAYSSGCVAAGSASARNPAFTSSYSARVGIRSVVIASIAEVKSAAVFTADSSASE